MLPAALALAVSIPPNVQDNAPARRGNWLILHQEADGRWDADGFALRGPEAARRGTPGGPFDDVAVTSLALLALVADGGAAEAAPYREPVARAADWLAGEAELAAVPRAQEHPRFLRHHALATLALCELAYFTQDGELAAAARRAVRVLEERRRADGGWSADGASTTPSDGWTTGWAALALASALDAGVAGERAAFEAGLDWIRGHTDSETGLVLDGDADPGSAATRKATALALLCRLVAGERLDEHPELRAAAATLTGTPPAWSEDGAAMDPELTCVTTLAAVQIGGRTWSRWHKSLKPHLVGHVETLTAAGPVPVDPELVPEGSVAGTAYALLTLTAYYRYSRIIGAR